MVQWANKGTSLRAAQFNYGSNPNTGAVNHWGGTGDMGYGGGVPTAGQWHHIALTYTGGTNGTETVYVDGQYNYSGTKTLNLFTSNSIRLANASGTNYFSGSMASVQIYSYALSLDEIRVVMNPKAWNPRPEDESEGIDEPVTLQWSGRYLASWHDVYFGNDKTAVSNANNSAGPCDTCIYRARLSAGNTSYAIPEDLQAGTTYYWRIDELDSGGSVLSKGTVWSFTVQGPKANSPYPANGTASINLLTLLGWKSGTGADKHDVFFV